MFEKQTARPTTTDAPNEPIAASPPATSTARGAYAMHRLETLGVTQMMNAGNPPAPLAPVAPAPLAVGALAALMGTFAQLDTDLDAFYEHCDAAQQLTPANVGAFLRFGALRDRVNQGGLTAVDGAHVTAEMAAVRQWLTQLDALRIRNEAADAFLTASLGLVTAIDTHAAQAAYVVTSAVPPWMQSYDAVHGPALAQARIVLGADRGRRAALTAQQANLRGVQRWDVAIITTAEQLVTPALRVEDAGFAARVAANRVIVDAARAVLSDAGIRAIRTALAQAKVADPLVLLTPAASVEVRQAAGEKTLQEYTDALDAAVLAQHVRSAYAWLTFLGYNVTNQQHLYIRQLGVFNGRNMHASIYYNSIQNPAQVRVTDTEQVIVDQLVCGAGAQGARAHATLEAFGAINAGNPHVYRNGGGVANNYVDQAQGANWAAVQAALTAALAAEIVRIRARVNVARAARRL
jgi:hypothetical protein